MTLFKVKDHPIKTYRYITDPFPPKSAGVSAPIITGGMPVALLASSGNKSGYAEDEPVVLSGDESGVLTQRPFIPDDAATKIGGSETPGMARFRELIVPIGLIVEKTPDDVYSRKKQASRNRAGESFVNYKEEFDRESLLELVSHKHTKTAKIDSAKYRPKLNAKTRKNRKA
jgi:hypothetical protein